MLNLSNLAQPRASSESTDDINFNNELDICLKSLDFERLETSRFILCYLSNLLVLEYRTKFNQTSVIISETDQLQATLRLFVNKLLNVNASIEQKDHAVLKELSCLCLSLIGPIDFKTYYLPIDKMEKFETCLNFPKNFTSLRDYTMNVQNERRLFILQNLAKYSTNQMFQFYYFLVEHLLEILIGHW